MKITQKRLKEIIKEELENLNLSEMEDTSSDTAAAMEGSDHMAQNVRTARLGRKIP